MPIYYFHWAIKHHAIYTDGGADKPDTEEARRGAIAVLRERGRKLLDDSGREHLTVSLRQVDGTLLHRERLRREA